MSILITSAVRTITPVIAGIVLNALVRFGLSELVDVDQLNLAVSGALTTLLTAAYYVGARWLETFRSSKWGWLLGSPTAPTYHRPQ